MRKWILVGGAALVGIVLAFLLLPSPDTGADIADRDRTVKKGLVQNSAPAPGPAGKLTPASTAKPAPESGRVTRPGMGVPKDRTNSVKGADTRTVAAVERRSQPDAVTAGRASAPWSLIRRQILRNEDPFSKEVLEESAEIIGALRKHRRDPDSGDFDALEKRQLALASRIRDSELGQQEEISSALGKLDELLESYHEQINEQ